MVMPEHASLALPICRLVVEVLPIGRRINMQKGTVCLQAIIIPEPCFVLFCFFPASGLSGSCTPLHDRSEAVSANEPRPGRQDRLPVVCVPGQRTLQGDARPAQRPCGDAGSRSLGQGGHARSPAREFERPRSENQPMESAGARHGCKLSTALAQFLQRGELESRESACIVRLSHSIARFSLPPRMACKDCKHKQIW